MKQVVVCLLFLFLNVGTLFGQFEGAYRKHSLKEKKLVSLDLQGFYDVTKDFPRNHVTDGSVDYGKILQICLIKNRKIILPNYPILIDEEINVPSNTVLYFQSNSKLIKKPTADSRYAVLSLSNVKNIQLYNVNIEGDRRKHKGKGGEWGYGIEIKSSKDVLISGGVISNCWGDGIVLSPSKQGLNERIIIENVLLDYNRRNGISIIAGSDIVIRNSVIQNSMGTNPHTGILIEPDHPENRLGKIDISNNFFYNNVTGIGINLSRYTDRNFRNTINLKLFKNRIKSSDIAIHFASFKIPKSNRVGGSVNIEDLYLENIVTPISKGLKTTLFPEINLKNISLVDNKLPSVKLLKKGIKDMSNVKISR